MEPQSDTLNDSYQAQCMCRTGRLFGDVRLTLSTGTPSGQQEYFNFVSLEWGFMPQGEPMGILPTTYPPSFQASPQVFHLPDAGTAYPYDGPETWPPDGPDEPPPFDIGVYLDPDVAFGGDFQRCSASFGSPIHLTTNTTRASSHVSHPHLVQEVCRCSVRKTRWY
jgi:hypothetical protein